MPQKRPTNHAHTAHPDVIKRLRRATGHLQNVIAMIEAERSCMDITQQLHAVEKAISAAKKLVIHDHLDHCLDGMTLNGVSGIESSISEFKNITKYL
jgi:DNA-binding FrmR family transcriptional regulator